MTEAARVSAISFAIRPLPTPSLNVNILSFERCALRQKEECAAYFGPYMLPANVTVIYGSTPTKSQGRVRQQGYAYVSLL